MKKTDIKRYLCVLMGGFMVLLCACSASSTTEEGKETGDTLLGYADITYNTYTEDGVFYTDNNVLYYRDNASSMEVALCDKANCTHDTKDCYAYFSLNTYAVPEDGKLLLVTGYGADVMGDMFLYQSDVNGTNRKKLADLGRMQIIRQVSFTDEYIILVYSNNTDENFEQLEESHAAVYVYNRKDGTGKEIWSVDAWAANVFSADIHDGELYVEYMYSDLTMEEAAAAGSDELHSKLVRISMDGETQVICEQPVSTGKIEFCKDTLFYNENGSLMSYNTTTQEKTSIGEPLEPAITTVDGVTVFSKYVDDTQENVYYLYREETGELSLLGRVKDVFINMCCPDYTYVSYTGAPSGDQLAAYYDTEEFLAGNLDSFTVYRNDDGSEKYTEQELTDFSYDPSLQVEIEGDVDSPEEAFAIVLEEFTEAPSVIQNLTAVYSVENGEDMYTFEVETEAAYYRYTVKCKMASAMDERCFVTSSQILSKQQGDE